MFVKIIGLDLMGYSIPKGMDGVGYFSSFMIYGYNIYKRL